MATTTRDQVRDRIRTVLAALIPTVLPATRFIEFRNEDAAQFIAWAEKNPSGALRRFQVRDDGKDLPPETSDMLVEQRHVTFIVTVCYPQSHRYGHLNALDRDTAMGSDQLQIESAIGWTAGANFAGANPNATWRSSSTSRVVGVACDFLQITQQMSYWRSVA